MDKIDLKPLRDKVEALNQELLDLSDEERRLEQRLGVIREQKRKLNGQWAPGTGKIRDAKADLDSAQLYNADLGCARVVFMEDHRRHDVYVVRRITPKRIFIARIGFAREEQFTRDGSTPGRNKPMHVIDVVKTLGG